MRKSALNAVGQGIARQIAPPNVLAWFNPPRLCIMALVILWCSMSMIKGPQGTLLPRPLVPYHIDQIGLHQILHLLALLYCRILLLQ